jgi:lipoate synthase
MNHNLETVPRLYRMARPGAGLPELARCLLKEFKLPLSRYPDQIGFDGRAG